MSRFIAFNSWFFTCLGITLLGVSILVVPADAFADAGSSCYSICNQPPYNANDAAYNACVGSMCCPSECGGSGNSCFNSCVGEACQLKYANDPNGLSTCCQTVCGSNTNDCYNNCLVAQCITTS